MIKILEPGLYSSIQDEGREDFQKYGVPFSGCMDSKSSNFANSLLNNPKNAAVIEATQFGPKILFNVSTYISITGGDMNPLINNKKISMNKAVNINKGDVLKLGHSKNGLRSYIAIKDGIKYIPEGWQTPHPQCFSGLDHLKTDEQFPIKAYREFYKADKLKFARACLPCRTHDMP